MKANFTKLHAFTLIELVLAIALIGIIAAVAVPKFSDFSSDAHKSSVSATHGAFVSAMHLAHVKWIANGGGSSVDIDGNSIPISSSGWPGANIVTTSVCVNLWNQLLVNAPSVQTTFTSNGDGYYAVALFSICVYLYQPNNPPTTRGWLYIPSSGTTSLINP